MRGPPLVSQRNSVWPLDDSDDQMVVEMSGLPVFDREREFTGFRGFGICRDRC